MAMVLLCGCCTACDVSDYDTADTRTSTSTEEQEDDVTTTTTTKTTTTTTKTTTTKKTTTTTKKTTKITTTKAPTTTVQMVWIPASGSKYHSRSSCSNMKIPSQVTKSRAIELGYSPCSRCY